MNEATFDAIDILGSRVRMQIVISLYNCDLSAADFAAGFEISIPAVMKHLKILEDAGLITRKKIGRRNVCTLDKEMLSLVASWPDLLEVSWLDMLTLVGE